MTTRKARLSPFRSRIIGINSLKGIGGGGGGVGRKFSQSLIMVPERSLWSMLEGSKLDKSSPHEEWWDGIQCWIDIKLNSNLDLCHLTNLCLAVSCSLPGCSLNEAEAQNLSAKSQQNSSSFGWKGQDCPPTVETPWFPLPCLLRL